MIKKVCKFCKKELITTKTSFCNMFCYNQYRKNQTLMKACDNCGKKHRIRKRYLKRNKHFFCCLNCMYEYKRKNDLREFSVNDSYFDMLTPQSCWLLGLLASDGNITKDRFIKISQSGKEGLNCINYIKKELEFAGPIFSYLPKISNNKVYSLTINSKNLVNKLKDYNIIQNKTKIFKIPQIILNNEDFLRWFLIGYIDGDGCIGIYKQHLLVVCWVCNNLMAKQLKRCLNNIELNINKLKKSDFLHEFRLNGEKAYLFGKYLYNDINKVNIYQSYKYKKFINFEQKYIQKTKWYRYQQLYKQLKEDLTNNNFINNTRWGKLHNAGHNWIIKNKKIILKELQNEI